MSPEVVHSATKSFLVVEDERSTLDLLISILTLKYPMVVIHSANNGMTALELFTQHAPKIVITDINMSGMNGLQLAEKIRALTPDAQIIALTGNSNKLSLHDSPEDEFPFAVKIMKPVVFQDLFAAIDRCLYTPE